MNDDRNREIEAAVMREAEALIAELRETANSLRTALAVIAKGETTVFDEDLKCDVTVSLAAEEMSGIAIGALSRGGVPLPPRGQATCRVCDQDVNDCRCGGRLWERNDEPSEQPLGPEWSG